jgi:hypothetical protein
MICIGDVLERANNVKRRWGGPGPGVAACFRTFVQYLRATTDISITTASQLDMLGAAVRPRANIEADWR